MKVFEGISSPWREVACGAGVRKGKGRELGRETAREGGGRRGFSPFSLARPTRSLSPKFHFPLPLLTPTTQAISRSRIA